MERMQEGIPHPFVSKELNVENQIKAMVLIGVCMLMTLASLHNSESGGFVSVTTLR